MGKIENRLKELNLELPEAAHPVGNYLGSKSVGNLLFASGRVSHIAGEVGNEVSLQQAQLAARDTVLMILSIIKKDVCDLDKLKAVVKLQGFVRSAAGFSNQPAVIDGASNLLIEIFGEDGRHARTATGINELPAGACVQLDIIFELKL